MCIRDSNYCKTAQINSKGKQVISDTKQNICKCKIILICVKKEDIANYYLGLENA